MVVEFYVLVFNCKIKIVMNNISISSRYNVKIIIVLCIRFAL